MTGHKLDGLKAWLLERIDPASDDDKDAIAIIDESIVAFAALQIQAQQKAPAGLVEELHLWRKTLPSNITKWEPFEVAKFDEILSRYRPAEAKADEGLMLGWAKCERCYGTGRIVENEYQLGLCPECKGAGEIQAGSRHPAPSRTEELVNRIKKYLFINVPTGPATKGDAYEEGFNDGESKVGDAIGIILSDFEKGAQCQD